MTDALVQSERREIELRSGHRLLIRAADGGDVLELRSAEGGLTLSLRLTSEGAVLELGGSLSLRAAGSIRIEAEQLELHGRDGLALTSGGDITMATPGDMTTEARIQRMRSTLGNVEIEANDDLRLDGERVLVNC